MTDAPNHRWVTLAIVVIASFIIVIDNSVLNVAIPTILHDFHTSLSTLEWVITGYALTFATLLIIGGRLGDLYGHRRIFMIGTGLFCVGSLIAALSQNVTQLILGEAIIEGIGASLMLPATLAILSDTFQGRQRATAFAAWGATAGVAVAVGPLIGGFLTTNYSWRWSFGINVIIAPLAILGTWLFMRPAPRTSERARIDGPGAGLVAAGMFLLVFALSEGSRYGWGKPITDFRLGSVMVWPESRSVSIVPLLLLASFVILVVFYRFERSKERRKAHPLFEFEHFKLPTYRYGLLTGLLLGMGQLGLGFVLAQYLQTAKHLRAVDNGLWLLPAGVFVIIGAQIGGRLAHRYGPAVVVRLGLLSYAAGILAILRVVNLDITLWRLLPGLALYGIGIGFAGAQLSNVVLSEIPGESSGVASGTNTTFRQVGMALGVAVIGAVLTTATIGHATRSIETSDLAQATRTEAVAGVHALGVNYVPPAGTSNAEVQSVQRALTDGVTQGTRYGVVFAFAVVTLALLLALRIPNLGPPETEELLLSEVDTQRALQQSAA